MSIEVRERIVEDYWASVPCTGADLGVTAWVTEDGGHKIIRFAHGGANTYRENPPHGEGSLYLRLSVFARAVRRVIADGGSTVRLPGHGFFRMSNRAPDRITYETTCNEVRNFNANNLLALIEWAEED